MLPKLISIDFLIGSKLLSYIIATGLMKQYMVIEHFRAGCYDQKYDRLICHGRILPVGLNYLNSGVTKDQAVCYQLMETNSEELFATWFKEWEDLIDFEVLPID